MRFPWFTSHSRENTFSKYHWVLLSAGSSSLPNFALWRQHVFIRFGLLNTREPGDYRVWGGWWGSPGCGAPRGGSKPLKNCGWGRFAVGIPVECHRGRELAWEHEIPSGVDALPSRPNHPASLQTAWQVQPERDEPSKCKIRRYQR